MKPGPELDALVAEKVMGWVWVDGFSSETNAPTKWLEPKNWNEMVPEGWGAHSVPDVPKYSTDIWAAWEVVEKMRESMIAIGIAHSIQMPQKDWSYLVTAQEPNKDEIFIVEKSAPHAICLTALKAVGYEV